MMMNDDENDDDDDEWWQCIMMTWWWLMVIKTDDSCDCEIDAELMVEIIILMMTVGVMIVCGDVVCWNMILPHEVKFSFSLLRWVAIPWSSFREAVWVTQVWLSNAKACQLPGRNVSIFPSSEVVWLPWNSRSKVHCENTFFFVCLFGLKDCVKVKIFLKRTNLQDTFKYMPSEQI